METVKDTDVILQASSFATLPESDATASRSEQPTPAVDTNAEPSCAVYEQPESISLPSKLSSFDQDNFLSYFMDQKISRGTCCGSPAIENCATVKLVHGTGP